MPFDRGPYLTIAAFCENVIEDKSGVLSLIRIIDRWTVTAQGPDAPEAMPPTLFNNNLVLNLKSGDARGSHTISIEPELPSGERLPPMTQSIHLEGGNRGSNLIMRVNLELTMPGIYWFRILIDNEFLTQVPFEVIYTRFVPPQISR
jgi:hypothetical protein